MGICRDNLSAIVIGDNLLPIIVIALNSLDLSMDIYRDNLSAIIITNYRYRSK